MADKCLLFTKLLRPVTSQETSTSTSANLKYVLTDLQGSARALMDNSGGGTSTIISRRDYLPFGEEIFEGVGLRTTTQKYSVTDKVRQRFAMTERDEATGLEHTWFRKYDSFAGRWTSPDPYGGSMSLANPQSLNRYIYAQNDPINFIDPLGLDPIGVLGGALGAAAAANPFIFETVTVPIDNDEKDIERTSGEPTEGTLMPRPAPEPQNLDDDCRRFADIVDKIAVRTNVVMATPDSRILVQDFMDALARRFTEFSGASYFNLGLSQTGVRNDSYKEGEFGSTGFAMAYFEEDYQIADGWVPANQVRHAVGGLIAGFVRGKDAGLAQLNAREDPSDERHGVPDINLNSRTVPYGALIADRSRALGTRRPWELG